MNKYAPANILNNVIGINKAIKQYIPIRKSIKLNKSPLKILPFNIKYNAWPKNNLSGKYIGLAKSKTPATKSKNAKK